MSTTWWWTGSRRPQLVLLATTGYQYRASITTLHNCSHTQIGELNPAAGALQQGHAQLGLEPADLLAERGLRDVQSLRGTPEVELLGNRDEVLDQPEIEPFHSLSLLIRESPVLDFASP